MATVKRKSKCSPAIWKKLGQTEKRWWMMFYRDFMGEMKANGTLPDMTKVQRECIAHNHACLATWAMRGVMKRVFMALKGPARK